MNPQTLTKINGFVKNRLIEWSSSIIILIDIFLLLSILSYSPSDPNFIYNPENIKFLNDNTRKCMIELRPNVSGKYKGLVYCSSINESENILSQLKEVLDIPVFHDDQHGTAIITTAALINALDISKKKNFRSKNCY